MLSLVSELGPQSGPRENGKVDQVTSSTRRELDFHEQVLIKQKMIKRPKVIFTLYT